MNRNRHLSPKSYAKKVQPHMPAKQATKPKKAHYPIVGRKRKAS